jgi:hypothetical protein
VTIFTATTLSAADGKPARGGEGNEWLGTWPVSVIAEKQSGTFYLAKACAFLTCHALGLDTARYSFAYFANWAEDPEELLPSAERACKASDQILEALYGS